MEAWKSQNINQYPLKLESNNPNRVVTDRVSSMKTWKDDAKSVAAKLSLNNAPDTIENALSLNIAKNEIKKFCSQIPL